MQYFLTLGLAPCAVPMCVTICVALWVRHSDKQEYKFTSKVMSVMPFVLVVSILLPLVILVQTTEVYQEYTSLSALNNVAVPLYPNGQDEYSTNATVVKERQKYSTRKSWDVLYDELQFSVKLKSVTPLQFYKSVITSPSTLVDVTAEYTSCTAILDFEGVPLVCEDGVTLDNVTFTMDNLQQFSKGTEVHITICYKLTGEDVIDNYTVVECYY